jgi:hypothetical protein
MLGARIGSIQTQKKRTGYVYIPFNNTVTEYESDVPITLTPVNVSGSSFIDSSADALRGTRPSIKINNGNYLSLKNTDSDLIFKLTISDPFTIQGYFKARTNATHNVFFNIGNLNTGGLWAKFAGVSPSLSKFGAGGGGPSLNGLFNTNTWYHIAITHEANDNSIKLYKDEVFLISTTFGTDTINNIEANKIMLLGANIHNTSAYLDGWLSDFIFIKGQAISTKIYP